MRKRSLLFLSLLVPAFLGLGGYAVLIAQQTSTAGAKRWSDAATWPDKKVPGKDAVVSIGRDMNVILDVSPPALHGQTFAFELPLDLLAIVAQPADFADLIEEPFFMHFLIFEIFAVLFALLFNDLAHANFMLRELFAEIQNIG